MPQMAAQQRAPIVGAGGALILRDVLSERALAALRREGFAAQAAATRQESAQTNRKAWRGGDPPRRFGTAEGGPAQAAIYADPALARRLAAFCGRPLRPTGEQGTFSYYDRPGDFLGLHRDIARCDVTLITCLSRREGIAPSGALRLYPKSAQAPLDEIDGETHRDINMVEGVSVLLLGGYVPHEVLPAAPGFSRIISVLCFQLID